MVKRGDFYEDDEPIEKLEAAFEQGHKVTSEQRGGNSRGWNARIVVTGLQLPRTINFGNTRAASIH